MYYRMRAILSRGLYIFIPFFNVVYIVERLKLSFFQKATKICEIFPMILTKIGLNHLSLTLRMIAQIFVAFSEKLNFNITDHLCTVVCIKVHKIAFVWCKTALGEVGVSLP